MQYATSSENYSSSMRGDSPSKWGPKDDKGYVYKKSSYQYSSTGNGNSSTMDKPVDTNIDQLDALLEDLKNERQFSRDKHLLSSSTNYRTLERDRAEPAGTITKTTRVIKTSKQSVPHAVLDDIERFSTSDYSTLKSNGYPSVQDYQTKEKVYGSNNLYESKRIYGSNRVLENTELGPSSSTTATHLEKDLQNIALTEDILPVPGTKVTTTVRTYTYEVPANGTLARGTPLTSSYNTIQRNELNTSMQSSPHPVPTIPQSVVYNTESYSTLNRNSERPVVSNQLYEVREHRETNTTQNSLQPQPHSPPVGGTNKTIVYKVNTTENIHAVPEFNNYPPARSPDYGLQPTTGGPHSPPHDNYPTGPTSSKYFYKESSNVINTIHGPNAPNDTYPGYNGPPQQPQQLSPSRYPPSANEYPPHGPPNPSTVTYKYSSTTTNSRRGPDVPYGTSSPATQPAPFPVDGVEYPDNGNPPQRVDDLMHSLGNVDSVDRSDTSIHRKREIETGVASPNQQQIPSVNKAGKEIYYPPGHEMMLTKREEMAAGSAAGGRWAKGSGMYEYESGSKSKSKTKSGGAMIPTTATHLEKDLQNIALTEDILPVPGTKVTTTVRTYTYEVPANGTLARGTPLTSSYNTIQRNELNTSMQSSPHPVPTIPQSVVYNTESYSTLNRNSERPVVSNQLYEVREHRETNTTQNSLQPQPHSPPVGGTNKTIVYKVNTTENIHAVPEFNNYPPARSPDYGLQPTTGGPHSPPHDNYPTGPTSSKYFYKESSNVINTIHGPNAPNDTYPGYNGPPQQPQQLSPSRYPPSANEYPPHGPPNPSTVTYKYSSTTTNSRRGPDVPYGTSSPATQPAPFPVDGVEYPDNGNPPQRVDDLMHSLGNVDSVDRSDTSIHRKREIETGVASPNQQQIPSVNKAGKEIYYPPGHEMMLTKREEMAAGSAAGGRWAKGSGMYEYESGSKSKSKTKSGGAMIPVCLPLCCAMPCSIM